jgi:hypothetical protein
MAAGVDLAATMREGRSADIVTSFPDIADDAGFGRQPARQSPGGLRLLQQGSAAGCR